jgi:cytidyltransferase-like protein
MEKKIVLVSGGFDPLHSGHLAYFDAAKKLGNELWVGVNSDAWLTRKKGRAFMPFEERVTLIKNLHMVDQVLAFEDDNLGSSNNCIEKILSVTGSNTKIIVANGGDRNPTNIPELIKYSDHPRVEFAWEVGGTDKKNSSSWILEEWKAPKTDRTWGYYRVLHESKKQVKVKELTVNPGSRLSMQRHKERAEHWFVDSGTATVYTLDSSSDVEVFGVYKKHQSLHIPVGTWHQLVNEHNEPLKLIEIQYGTNCAEEDIERRN